MSGEKDKIPVKLKAKKKSFSTVAFDFLIL